MLTNPGSLVLEHPDSKHLTTVAHPTIGSSGPPSPGFMMLNTGIPFTKKVGGATPAKDAYGLYRYFRFAAASMLASARRDQK
ncbi:unnamed protein product [Clonostachys rosea f. rosea IK726]|uniref:Uncharacterized protein n=2 Tax=Bionectria ochroleuca TaxID=29856 RepID=A0A0B7KPL3_BIOOC|nr:unnamed protein product [Clonostachys rosea f. rosea IK726]